MQRAQSHNRGDDDDYLGCAKNEASAVRHEEHHPKEPSKFNNPHIKLDKNKTTSWAPTESMPFTNAHRIAVCDSQVLPMTSYYGLWRSTCSMTKINGGLQKRLRKQDRCVEESFLSKSLP